MYKLTWINVLSDSSIETIEHPLSGCLIPKKEFGLEFETLLLEFDGTTASDYFDFYFNICPLNTNAYKFRDNDTKKDFIDACIDLKIIPSLCEIYQGECKEDKEIRRTKSSKDLIQDFKQLKSKEMSHKYHTEPSVKKQKEKEYKSKAQQLQNTYDYLIYKIKECKDLHQKRKLEQKLERCIKLMDHSM